MEQIKYRLHQKLILNIVIVTLSRLLLNTSRRFIYTFAGTFSRALGVPLTSVTNLIAINQGTSVLGILFGPLGDQLGYKLMILFGMSCLTVGMLAAGILPFYGVIAAAMFLAGLGKSIVDPAIQAYAGQKVPYHRRGLVVGIMELAWAGSTLIGIPLMGILIDKLDWQAPFLAVGLISLLFVILVAIFFPKDPKKIHKDGRLNETLDFWKQILVNRTAVGVLLFAFFIAVANDAIFVVYGTWLEDSFNLSIIALGISTSVIGIAEFAGEALTAFFSDKIGLKKSCLLGLLALVISFVLLPLADINLTAALVGLFFIFVSFEFTFVTSMSLSTELVPGSRATMMSAFYAVAGIGHMIGAILGGIAWSAGKLTGTSVLATSFSVMAVLALVWGTWSWNRKTEKISEPRLLEKVS